MKKKRRVAFLSFAGFVIMFVAMNSVSLGLCEQSAYVCRGFMDKLEHVLYIFPFILLFSIATYKMKETTFLAWWKFARVAVPVILILSFVISLGFHHHPGGWFNIDSEIDLILYFLMYAVFVAGSIVQIYSGYHPRSGGGNM